MVFAPARMLSQTSTTSDPHAYLKWPRLIVFNINGAVSIAATALASRSLVNLNSSKRLLAAQIPGGKLHTVNVVTASACMTTAAGIASLYTAALAVMITFHLQRRETRRSIAIKEIAMIFMAGLLLAAAVAATIIIVPRSAGVSAPGLPQALLVTLIQSSGKSLKYRDSLAFPALICVWVCFGTTLLSFFLATLAHRHIRRYGPEDTLVGHSYTNEKKGMLAPQHGTHQHLESVNGTVGERSSLGEANGHAMQESSVPINGVIANSVNAHAADMHVVR